LNKLFVLREEGANPTLHPGRGKKKKKERKRQHFENSFKGEGGKKEGGGSVARPVRGKKILSF